MKVVTQTPVGSGRWC